LLTGKTTFGFNARYHQGEQVPRGNAHLQFKDASLSFNSTSYEWLVVSGSWAMLKGEGTINGQGQYEFELTVNDGSPDTFHMKIWYVDATGSEVVVYDNGSDQAIARGSISFHGN
jgi:hypothetical protein